MSAPLTYRLLADLLLVVHVAFVVFVVGGLVIILIGGWRGWTWVRRPAFRWLHLAAIAFVVAESWLGAMCPLTVWEMALRERAGEVAYGGDFIAHWLGELLYFEAPPWVFAAAYTAFALLVVWAWFAVPPTRKPRGAHTAGR